LPFDSIASDSINTSGLSAALFSSRSMCSRAFHSVASAAPCTCVTQRNDNGSWTRRAPARLPECALGKELGQACGDRLLARLRARRLNARIERTQVGAKTFE
jgi:hypothetical protein